MCKLTIIFGFRDREIIRVKRCLDSLNNQDTNQFKVLFIDYGSKSEVSEKVKLLLSEYSFCKYIYNDTRGWLWNRSHALNTGIKLTNTEYVMTSDIDLIFSKSFIKTIVDSLDPDLEIHSSAYALSRKFREWDKIHSAKRQSFKERDLSALGLVQVVKKSHLESITGFDEFYQIWGAEDEDLNDRLKSIGIKTNWLDLKSNPVYHQWHPSVGRRSRKNLPENWLDYINNYRNLRADLKRNEEWGILYEESRNRPALSLISEKQFDAMLNFNEASIHISTFKMQKILNQLESNQSIQALYINGYNEEYRKSKVNRIIRTLNRILYRVKAPFLLINEQEYFRYRSSTFDLRDLIVYFLRSNHSEILDHYLSFDENELRLIIIKK